MSTTNINQVSMIIRRTYGCPMIKEDGWNYLVELMDTLALSIKLG